MLGLYNAYGPLAERFVDGAARLAEQAANSAEYGRRTGELADFLDRAGIAAGALLPTAGNLGVGLGRVFEVGISGGANMLLGVERLSQRFADFTGSVAGER